LTIYYRIAAIGLTGPGAAPLALFDVLMSHMAPGGLFDVSLNDHALADPPYRAKVRDYDQSGRATVVFDERAPHLPGLDVHATVFVLKKPVTRLSTS
jgi:hypothetical protein